MTGEFVPESKDVYCNRRGRTGVSGFDGGCCGASSWTCSFGMHQSEDVDEWEVSICHSRPCLGPKRRSGVTVL